MMDTIKQAWSEEYLRKGIPSSFRTDPTKTVVEFISWLKQIKQLQGHAADIGCGLGRNSFYLAAQGFKVTGIELLEENTKAVNAYAATHKLPVHAYAQDAATVWPIEPASQDIAIDVFCYKHIVNKEKQAKYRQELWKTLKPGGFYFISLASEKDGFYGPLLEHSKNHAEKLVVDPFSKIASYLYAPDDLKREFANGFEVIEMKEQTSRSPMYGKEYPRMVINAIFRRSP